MERFKKLLPYLPLGLVGIVLLNELRIALGPRRLKRQHIYQQAVAAAARLNKPLMVLGDPDGGIVNRFIGRDYGCGAICTDLRGCDTCPIAIKGRAEDILPKFKNNSHVIYASMVLEYVDDYARVVRELQRVSGGDLFITTVEPNSVTAFLYPGAQRRILNAPPTSESIVAAELPWGNNPGVAI